MQVLRWHVPAFFVLAALAGGLACGAPASAGGADPGRAGAPSPSGGAAGDEEIPGRQRSGAEGSEGGPAGAAPFGGRGRLRPTRLWRVTWKDEFDGPAPGEDPSCYARPPQCVVHDWLAPKDCPATSPATGVNVHARLAKLNKCTWSVLSFQSFWSGTSEDGRAVNALDPGEVTVEGGDLVITGRARPGGYARDCGRSYEDASLGVPSRTASCPLVSGGVWAQPYGDPAAYGPTLAEGQVRGFKQAYGRFEFEGRLSHGTETWPAFWLMPHHRWDQSWVKGWPADGEIDVMEAWAPVDGYSANFHYAVPKNGRWVHIQDSLDWRAPPADKSVLFTASHRYAVEWDTEEMRFSLDGALVGRIAKGDTRGYGKYTDTNEGVYGSFAFDMPDLPFFPILNLTLKGGFPGANADPITGYPVQELRVGAVRAYEACAPGDASCVEATRSAICPRPCDGLGDWDGKGCVVGEAPKRDMDARVDGAVLSYANRDPNQLTSHADCAPGDAYDAQRRACLLGTVKGRRAWAENDPGPLTGGGPIFVSVDAKPGRFYVDPVCVP